jgi:transcriptional regulator with XRE-family HTH domain
MANLDKSVGTLLAYASDLADLPKRADVARSFSICIAQTTEGNISEFARRLGFLKSAVSQWRSGKVLPQLSVLLKVCCALNVSLIDFLLSSESLGCIKLLTPNYLKNSQPKLQQTKRQLETFSLQQSLQAALKEEPPPTMKTVAQRLGYSAISIRRRFPQLSSAVSARYLKHRDRTRMAKVEECCQEVRQVAIMLYNQGIEPTRSRVTQYLSKPAYFRDSMVTHALNSARQALGLD